MCKDIKLTPGYDPDKFRDELCEKRWRESGSKTIEEYFAYAKERLRNISKLLLKRDGLPIVQNSGVHS